MAAKRSAIQCLEDALDHIQQEIKAAEKALDDRKKAVEYTQGHLAGFYIDRDNLIEALAMVKKRVAP